MTEQLKSEELLQELAAEGQIVTASQLNGNSNSGGRFKKELVQLEFEKQLPEFEHKTRIVTVTNTRTLTPSDWSAI